MTQRRGWARITGMTPSSKPIIIVLAIVMALPVGACGFTPTGDAIRGAIAEKGKVFAKTSLENAIWVTCRAASIGSVEDRFGTSDSRAATYRAFCRRDAVGSVIGRGDNFHIAPDDSPAPAD